MLKVNKTGVFGINFFMSCVMKRLTVEIAFYSRDAEFIIGCDKSRLN